MKIAIVAGFFAKWDMYIQAVHFFAKVSKPVLAIFVLLQHLFRSYILFVVIFLLPVFAPAQDTIVLPDGYKPYYNWNELPDTLAIELRDEHPDRWRKDSLYYVLYNRAFADSLLNDSALKQSLFYLHLQDTVWASRQLTDTPPAQTVPRYKPMPLWVFWAALLVLVGIVFLKFSNIRLFNFMFLSFLFPKYCDEALREYDSPVNIYNLTASVICALSYSVFVWFLWIKTGIFQIHNSQLVAFLIIFMGISIFFLLRYLFVMISAAVLGAEYTYGVLVQVTVAGNMWMAVGLLPAIVLLNEAFIHYTSPMLPVYAVAGLLLYLVIKQVRVFIQVAGSFPHSIVYLILYLCALEIAPYLAIFKVVIKQTG